MRRRPTGNDRLTAVTDGGGRQAAMMGGSDGPWLERIDGRGRWAMRRASRHTEETGGCGRRTLGVMMGGGPADVAGFHHRSTFIGSFGHRWMDEEQECCMEAFGTIPRVRGGLGQHKPLVGRATGIRPAITVGDHG